MPQIGLGTSPLNDAAAAAAVVAAIEAGYRHIDTAYKYRNQRGVGQGIRDSGARREDLFVTTKLDGAFQGDDRAIAGLDECLRLLGLGVVAIPRSANPGRIAQNIDVFDFALTGDEVASISALDTGAEPGVDSDTEGH